MQTAKSSKRIGFIPQVQLEVSCPDLKNSRILCASNTFGLLYVITKEKFILVLKIDDIEKKFPSSFDDSALPVLSEDIFLKLSFEKPVLELALSCNETFVAIRTDESIHIVDIISNLRNNVSKLHFMCDRRTHLHTRILASLFIPFQSSMHRLIYK